MGWSKGWTHLEAFKFGGVQHMLAYRGSTGAVKINKITGSGDNVTFTNVCQGNWGTGLTHIKPVAHNGAVHVIRYKQGTGAVSFDRIASGAQGLTHLGDATWTKTWTVMSPFTQGNVGHVLVYKPSGLAKMLKLNAAGTGMTETYAAGLDARPGVVTHSTAALGSGPSSASCGRGPVVSTGVVVTAWHGSFAPNIVPISTICRSTAPNAS